jgi:hypothetical protein
LLVFQCAVTGLYIAQGLSPSFLNLRTEDRRLKIETKLKIETNLSFKLIHSWWPPPARVLRVRWRGARHGGTYTCAPT